MITSLLSLQASFIKDENAKALFRYSQYRINSMEMIHEMLYKADDVSKINCEDYIMKLVGSLVTSMKGSKSNVKVEVDIVPNWNFNIETAIPIGLLVNEIITNALKYGIPDDNDGTIKVEISRLKHDKYQLNISDDGVGFSDNFDFRSSNSLGMMLIHRLSLQLKGSIEKDNNFDGTKYILNFEEIYG